MAWWQYWKPWPQRMLGAEELAAAASIDLDPERTARETLQLEERVRAAAEAEEAPYRQMAENCFKLLAAEEAFVGGQFTETERKEKIWSYAQQLVQGYVNAQAEAMRADREDERAWDQSRQLNDILNQLDRIAQATENSPTNLALKLQREHPLLAGFLGADIALRVRGK